MAQKRAVTGKLAQKYRGCKSRKKKTQIVVQVMELTGYCRKYSAWLLRNYGKKRTVRVGNEITILVVGKKNRRRSPNRARKYGPQVKEEMEFIWDAFRLCGKRLAPMMPDILPSLIKRERVREGSDLHRKLLQISPATIDRLLVEAKAAEKPHGSTLTKPSSILKSYIPIVTSSELDTENPGHYQIDLVGHDGGNLNGHFARTLNVIELCSGWIEPRIVINEAHRWTLEAIRDIEASVPVPIQSIHSDNDSAFINDRLQGWCRERQILYLRGRPYHSNDTCHIEQKNYDIVRRAVGYYRYDSEQEIELITEIYANLRPLINYFFPSAKLLRKEKVGSRIRRIYDKPTTPYRRLMQSTEIPKVTKLKLTHLKSQFDPFDLKLAITDLEDKLIDIQKEKGGAILYPGPNYPGAREKMWGRLFG